MGKMKNKMMGIMHRMMYSCEQASFLVSKSFHQKLTFAEKQRLKMHLSMCKPCRNFKTNNTILNQGFQKISQQSHNMSTFKLSDQKKTELKKNIRNRI